MEIRVKKTVGSPSKTTTTLDLTSNLNASPSVKAKIKRDVGDFLIESINSSLSRAESPVAGESFQKLSKAYQKKKVAEGLPGKANLEFEGDMRDDLKYVNTADGIELGHFGAQAWKADGHLKFSGEENHTPKRRYLPAEGQEFVPEIQNEIERIVADAISGSAQIDPDDFDSVSTKAELYETLADYFPDLSRAAMKAAALRNPKLVQFLDDQGLLELL